MNDILSKNVCRICLVDNEQMASIYNGIIKETGFITYREMLEDCASVKVSDADVTTKMICSNCSTNLEKNHTFRIQCITSHKVLIERAKQGPIVKLEIIELKSENIRYSENNSNLKLENETTAIENNISANFENIVPKEEVNFAGNDNQEEISDVSSEADNLKIKKNVDNDFTRTVNFLPGKNKPSRTYKCNRCEKTFNLKIDSVRHLKLEHSDNSPLICTICNKKFAAKCRLTIHMATHGYNCKICLLSCETVEELEEHKKTHSNDSGFVCRECGKSFSKIVGLRGHYLRIHTEKRHLCTYCGKFFNDRQNLVTHLRIHTGDKPFTCKLCEASFYHINNLRRHMVSHSSERNYECKTCSKTFARLESLRIHMRTHDNVRNFACTICSRRFKNKYTLKEHHLTHTGERNFTCTTCNKSFFRRYHLKVHQKIHTGERPYTCSECGKTFREKHLRNKHLKSIHSKSVSNDAVLIAGVFTSSKKEELC